MKKTALIYWSKGGNTEQAAKTIYKQLNPETTEIFVLDEFDPEKIDQYELVILGGPTVGAENWEDAAADNRWNQFFRVIRDKDLSGTTFCFFGLGNQVLYPAHFVDGLGLFQEELSKTNARIIGKWPVEGYRFTDSLGVSDNMFYGLALDNDNEPEKTEERAKKWVEQIKQEAGI